MERLSSILHIAAALVVAACSGTPDREKESGEPVFKVALLTPGPISDRSWNGGAYAGLLRIRDSLGATISHIQTKTPAEFDENFRLYGSQGFHLVIGHGYEFQDAAKRVAPSFPRTAYVITSGFAADSPNVAGLRFAFEEPSYLAGLLAGALSRTGIVGCIGGTELPPVKASFEAFAAGVRASNRSAKVITSFIGNWDDVSAGREQALAQISQGVDIIFQNADAAGLGVFQAARQSRRVLVFGSNADQNDVAPEVTLGSVVIDLPRAFLRVAREVRAGTFRARVIELGAATDVVRLVLNPSREDSIPPAVRRMLDSVTAVIRAGSVTRVSERSGL